jgi:DNA polymerase III epsilon subunit-like protein
LYLFFDLETNGLAKSLNAPFEKIDNWARVVQIAWAIYDREGKKIKSASFIAFPKDFNITDASSAVHGITIEKAEKEGILLDKILPRFNDDLTGISLIVAHNIDFDLPTLNAEFLRNRINTDLRQKTRFCTMKSPEVVSFCKIPNPFGSSYKWPSLSELHKILFDTTFDGVHNASADVDACARCFFELKKRGIIFQN